MTTATMPAAMPTPLPDAQTLRQRLYGAALTERLWGWLGPLIVAVIGGALRFWRLGRPPWLVFDETYYVKGAASYLKYGGIEMRIKEFGGTDGNKTADQLWNSGSRDVWGNTPDFVVHPPVGKWMIAGGQWIFGTENPFGWRFASAVCGTLSILLIGVIGWRLFRSALLGTTASILLALDGQHFVHSRTGLLDVFVMFWALVAFGCILLDRDQARARLARRLGGKVPRSFQPGIGIRPWRIAAGIALGLCCGTKWSGIYFAAAFAIASVLWDVAARRAANTPNWLWTGLLRDGASAFLHIIPVMFVTYLLSWTGWFLSDKGHGRYWAESHPARGLGAWVPNPLRSLWHYHADQWEFSANLSSPHTYQSNAWSWLVQSRPTAFDYRGYKQGQMHCDVAGGCSRAINNFGSPVIWWLGLIALVIVLVAWLLHRDWRAGAIWAGIAGGYLPWFMYQHRTVYTFYTIAFAPFVVLGLTYVLGMMLGRSDASPSRRRAGAIAAGSIVILAMLAFWYFYPVWSDRFITYAEWRNRMWLPSWI